MPDQDPWAQMAASMQQAAPAGQGAASLADRPTPQITGDSTGVSLQTKVDPWEQEAAKFKLDAARASGQNLVPALQAADRVGGLPAEQPKPIPQLPTIQDLGAEPASSRPGFLHDLHHGGIVSELVEPEMFVKQRWADQFGSAAMQSERPQVEAWAKANRPGREVDPDVAAEYVRSTVDPATAAKYDSRFKMEHALYHAVQVRDQMAQQVAAQWKADYPNAHGPEADQEMYRAVQQQMLRLGVPEDKLPPFTVDGGTIKPVEVGRMHGWVDAWLKGSGDIAYGPAQAIEGAGQTLTDRFHAGRQGASTDTGFFEGLRQNTANSAQRYEQMLPGSTKNDTFQQITEGGARMAPQLIAAMATGRAALPGGPGLFGATAANAKTLATVLEGGQFFAQTAGQSYQGVYDAALKDGKTKEQASLAAGLGSTLDGVVAAAGMKFGALGQMQQRGLRTYLSNAIRAAGAQGGVAAAQDLTNQLVHYAASGGKEGLDVDRILKAGLQGAAAGAFTMASDPARVRAAWDTFSSSPAGNAAATAERMAGKFGDVGMGRDEAADFLGLKKGYTADDVRDAFREKVREAHPDAGGNQELFAKTMAARAATLGGLEGKSPSPTAGDNGRQPATGDGGSNQTPPPASATSVPEAQPSVERGSGNAGVGAQNTPADSALVTTPESPKPPTTPPPSGGAAVPAPSAPVGGDAAERARLSGIINSAGISSVNKQSLADAPIDTLRDAVEKLKGGGAARQVRKFLDGIAPRDPKTGERNYPQSKELLDGLKGNQALLEQLKAERQKHESLAQEVQRLDAMYGKPGDAGDDIIGRVRAENRAPLERLENEGGKEAPRGPAAAEAGPGKNHPRELADAHAVGEWYAKQFGEPENAGTIEALASMSKGKYVLAEVPAGKIDPSSLIAGDKDQAKVDALNKLTPEQRAALPPAILVAGPKGGGLMVADGSHRTLSAQQSGYPTVRAYVPERYVGQDGIERVTGTVEVEHRAKAPAAEPGGARAPTPDTSGRDKLAKKEKAGQTALPGMEHVAAEQDQLDEYAHALHTEQGTPLIAGRRIVRAMWKDGVEALKSKEQRSDHQSVHEYVGDQIWSGLTDNPEYPHDAAPHELLNRIVNDLVGKERGGADAAARKPRPTDYNFTDKFPMPSPEAMREGTAYELVGHDHEDDWDLGDQSDLAAIHAPIIEEMGGHLRTVDDARRTLDSGKGHKGKPLTPGQRNQFNDVITRAGNTYDGMLEEYSRHFGEEAAGRLDKFLHEQAKADAEKERLADAAAYQGENNKPFDASLMNALHGMSGAEKRWAALKEKGADDEQLRREIGRAFGIDAGASGRDGYRVKGRGNPKFWGALSQGHNAKPTLTGKKLLDEVRRLLEIPNLPTQESGTINGDVREQRESDVVPPPGQGPAAGGTVGTGGEGALGEARAQAAPAAQPGGPTGQRGEGGREERAGPLQPAGEPGGGPASGAGGREGALPAPDRLGERGREPDAGGSEPGQGAAAGVVREIPGHDVPALTGNHTITDAAKLDAGGAKTKFQQNVAAIETLRRVMAEGRQATAAEQEVLALYSGWGRFPQLFNAAAAVGAEGKWEQESKDVKDILTPEEWEAARKSTLNAHYSSPLLAVSMWQGMRRLGFAGGGRVLEPSMGAGIFFGLMPTDMRDGSRLTGVELDPITGNIARLLYPEANVQVKGFEQLVAPPGFFDAAIGNVPFGDYPLHDPAYKQLRTAPIHDYFIVKTLDLTRPGGVVALITSTGTMDKAEDRFRAMMREKADLVAAVRLPEGAFEKSAGTSVVTDLLIFKRRGEGESPAGPDFQGLKELPDPDGGAPIPVNTYFADNPEQILGTLDRKSRLYGRGDMHVSRTADFQKRLADAIDRLPAGVYKPAAAAHLAQPPKKAAPGSVKDGAYVKQGKKLFRRQGGELVEAEGDKKKLALIADTMVVRDALRDLIDAELASRSAVDVQQKREQLGRAYDEFVKKRGPLRKRSNVQAFADDPDAPVVQALEASYDPKTGEATKADVFTKSTVRGYDRPAKAGTAGEALGITLNETGHVDIARVAELLGKGQDDAGDELVKAGLAFRDPAGGWKSAEQYLGGNVKKKLLEAREAAAGEKQYAPNVEALDKVQPADVPHDEIDLRLGAGWVPASDVRDFAQSMLGGIAEHFSVRYIAQQGTWLANYTDTGLKRHKHSPNDTTVWGTDRAGFIDVFEAALNNKSITITDPVPGEKDKRVVNREATAAANEKVEKVQQAFRDWVWEGDDRRQRLHRFYNDTFNNLAPVKFDGSHLTFPGMNPSSRMRAHQANAVWQTISTGIGLYGHEVGTGKTFVMAAAAMELRRLGLARKPAIATIKAAFETVVKQTRALYPSAKVLAVDSFEAKGRKAAVARIATGDWDVVVLTHDQLDMLAMDPEVEAGFIRRELAELEEVKRSVEGEDTGQAYGRGRKNDNRMVKALEKIKARLEARLKEAIDSKKDNAVTFEQTGIDHLFVDEAHRYKSLPVYTKQDRVKGIPKSRSDRATNMWMRTQWLQQMNNGRGVVFATGTPVTNTMAELYTMQRYLQMRELESRGVAAFDAWASTFGRLVTKMEYTVTGDYAPSTRFAAFTNMPELQQIARQVIDIQRAKDMPGFQRPKRVDEVVKAPMSRQQLSYLNEIKDRAREAKKKRPGEKGDNMLSISMDARKSALDHRIIDPTAPDFADSKTNQIVRNVLKFHAQHPGTTQMIFSDLGISQNDGGFSFYESLIDKLVQGGIPREKVINFGDLTDAQKKDAADRLAAGDALVGIGGSEKLGTGVNAQQHLVALHHADVPWVPAFVEQRDGRGWRQGNANPTGKIHIFRYVTEGSFDTFMWQAVDAKTKFINQFMEGKKIARAISEDDGEELSPAQVMAIASGNPLLLTRIQLDKDVQDLTAAANRHQRDSLRLRDDAAKLRGEITEAKGVGAKLAPDLATATKHAEDKFSIEIDGKSYADRGEAQDALDRAVESIPPRGTSSDKRVPLGTYRGFPLEGYRSLGSARVVLVGANITYDADSSVGSIEYRARQSTIQGMVDRSLQLLRVYEADLAKLLPQIGKPFPRAADLEAKQKQLRDVTTQLAAANEKEPAKAAATPARGEREGVRDPDDDGGGAYSRVSEPTPLPILHNSVAVHGPAAAGGRKLLRPMEMPELLKLARSIMQTGAPVMKKLRGSVAGKFKSVGGFGTISIDPRKVKGAHEIAAALAHEVGHLEDWLPLGGSGNPPTLSRGNVVGSIAKLNRHMAQTWGGALGPNKDLRKQLIALSEWWSPYDKAQAKASYIQYRESPRELYAELLSVLLNAPGEVEARAPLAYKQFLEHLDRHAEFRDAYLTLQDVLAGTPQELAAGRRKDIREAYARGEDILKARAKERATNRTSIIGVVKQILFDRSEPVLALQKQAEKKIGTRLPEALNAKYALGELAYSDNTNHLMLRRLEEEVVAPVKRAGMGLPELGEYLQLHRTATERSEMANPQGHTPATAAAMLKDLEREVGPVRYAALEKAITTFHDIIFEAVDHAADVGTYSREKVDKELEPNKYNYATFAVLDYLDEHISHAIIQQHGTFKDVANPFVSTVMKTMSLNRMNDLQEAKNTTIRMMLRHFPTDIAKGRARHGAGGMPLPPGKPPRGREWLPVYEDGKLRHYAVDPYVAKVFANHDVGMLATVGRWLSLITYRPFHPLYVTWNVGWAMGLIPSDFQRTWRNNAFKGNPVTLREILKAYRTAAPIAYRRVRRRPDATIDAMLKAKALDVPWQDYEFHEEHDSFARMLDRYGLGDKPVKKGGVIRAAVKWLQNTQHAVEGMGSFVVSVPKIAGWQMLAARGIPEHERAYRVRNFMGHPDRKRKGLATVLTNPVFMYSNILIQFLRADAEAATEPTTRAGFWLRWGLSGALPKILMRLAAAGLMGAGLKALMAAVPESDKQKGTVIPIGWARGPKGDLKARYILIPTDPWNRLMGGLLWKLTSTEDETLLHRMQGVLDAGYSDAPHISPTLQMANNWQQYLRGQNPYDDFRRRNVISDDDFKAGGWYANKDMLSWTGNQFGQASVLAHWLIGKSEGLGERETTGEKVVGSVPGLSRFLKTSDRGIREKEELDHTVEDAEAARFRLSLPDEVRNLVRERYRLELEKENISDDDRERRAELSHWYGSAYLRLTKEIKAAEHDKDADTAKELRAALLESAKQHLKE